MPASTFAFKFLTATTMLPLLSTAASSASIHAIDGHTAAYCIVAHPAEQVQAPTGFNRIFALLGINAVPVPAAPADLQAFVKSAFAASHVHGPWVTIPHKVPMPDALNHISDMARMAATSNNSAEFDVVINASSLDLKSSDPLPCDVAKMDVGAALVDILMEHRPAPSVCAARARGLVAEPGFGMMVQQTHCYLDFFGFTDAARKIREDADFLRQLIYPAELPGEIRKPAKFLN